MGDRCWLQVTFHPDDIDKIPEHSDLLHDGEDEDRTPSGGIVYTFYEANYGLNDALCAAANAGVRFKALQGHGDEYTAGIVIGWDNEVYELNTDNDFGYIVPVNSNGEVLSRYLERVREFITIEKKFEDCLNEIASVQREVVPLKDWKPCDDKKPDG